jgi:hypothetical protein
MPTKRRDILNYVLVLSPKEDTMRASGAVENPAIEPRQLRFPLAQGVLILSSQHT